MERIRVRIATNQPTNLGGFLFSFFDVICENLMLSFFTFKARAKRRSLKSRRWSAVKHARYLRLLIRSSGHVFDLCAAQDMVKISANPLSSSLEGEPSGPIRADAMPPMGGAAREGGRSQEEKWWGSTGWTVCRESWNCKNLFFFLF